MLPGNGRAHRGPAEAGNYKKGHLKIGGLNVTIENGKGSIRSGKGPDVKPWSVEMPAHYGYVKGTEGADGDQMDVFIGAGGGVAVVNGPHSPRSRRPGF